jgi:hypothetical protein
MDNRVKSVIFVGKWKTGEYIASQYKCVHSAGPLTLTVYSNTNPVKEAPGP